MKKLPLSPEVLLMGDPHLFNKQPWVASEDISHSIFQHNVDVLLNSQKRCTGVGLAAPQIGWAARIMTIGIEKKNPRYPWAGTSPLEIWINPELVSTSKETSWVWEGCLSVPGFRGWVERPASVRVKGLNRDGQPVEKELKGFMARVFQHEMDHLDGVLFPLRVISPRHIVPMGSFENQSGWPDNWPTPGAHQTRPGEVSSQP